MCFVLYTGMVLSTNLGFLVLVGFFGLFEDVDEVFALSQPLVIAILKGAGTTYGADDLAGFIYNGYALHDGRHLGWFAWL